ncbi:type VI secretion system protein TssA [Aquicoccus sp. SCR17]|nr:type VI secretion system protein TssA [Carideicomes alvinocaridis]
MDFGAFQRPIDDAHPSGENLEYEMIFTEMELASHYGEEQQMGDHVREAEPPDFAELAEKAEAVLGQSHDIRAAVFLAEAALQREGITGFAGAVGLIRHYLEEYWDSCHPQLDEDDGDATMRINAVQGLADKERVVRALRRAGLSDSRAFGRVSLRQIDVAEGRIEPRGDEEPMAQSAVSAAFQDSDPEALAATLEALKAARADAQAIEAAFSEHTPGEGPQLDALTDTLRAMEQAMGRFGAGGSEEAAGDDGEAASPDMPAANGSDIAGPAAAGPAGGGAIRSPEDVTAALDRIMTYYARQEPSSPVPILLGRAKRLVGADFMTIMKDMAHEGVDEVRKIGGLPDDDDNDDDDY